MKVTVLSLGIDCVSPQMRNGAMKNHVLSLVLFASACVSGQNNPMGDQRVVLNGDSLAGSGQASMFAAELGGHSTAANTEVTVNVKALGAKGNERVDDTAAIQRAFDTCNEQGGGIVFFPGRSTYKVTATINAHSGCRLVGSMSAGRVAQRPPEIAWWGPAGQDMLVFDNSARYFAQVKNIVFRTGGGAPNRFRNAVVWNSRIDTGSGVDGAQVSGGTGYGFYASQGGINVSFRGQWRCDGMKKGCVYWNVTGSDSFSATDFTVDNRVPNEPSSGGAFVLDASRAADNAVLHATFRNVKIETNSNLAPGSGIFHLMSKPSVSQRIQFALDFENVWNAADTHVTNSTGIVVTPASDTSAVLSILNSNLSIAGIPSLRNSLIATGYGWRPLTIVSSASKSADAGPASGHSQVEFVGDLNLQQIYQYGNFASPLLNAPTDFSTLSNGTTLYAGQLLTDPTGWNANVYRKTISNVYSTGTVGVLNRGATTCSGDGGTNKLICTSQRDLSVGQSITIGSERKRITLVDATVPTAVVLTLSSRLAESHSNSPVSFLAPLLGTEVQLPTKRASWPAAEWWSRGDVLENSAASRSGICLWVATRTGTGASGASPVGVPCGDEHGRISNSQLSGGFTGTKKVGDCMLTISNGMITDISGC